MAAVVVNAGAGVGSRGRGRVYGGEHGRVYGRAGVCGGCACMTRMQACANAGEWAGRDDVRVGMHAQRRECGRAGVVRLDGETVVVWM